MKLTSCCYQKNSYRKVERVHVCTNSNCTNYLGTTKIRYEYSLGVIWYTVLVLSLLLFPYNQSESYNTNDILQVYHYEPSKALPIPELTLENVEKEVRKNNILCAEQVCAQIKLESGNLKSWLLKRTNNMLGMRFPYRRSTTAVGIFLPSKDTIVYGTQKELLVYRKELSYAVYKNWTDAIKDYKLWQDQTFNLKKRYMDFLKQNYAEDTLYISKLNYITSKWFVAGQAKKGEELSLNTAK